MTAPKLSRAELRRRLQAADLTIQSRQGAPSAGDRLASRHWRSIPENERTLQEMEQLLSAVSKLPRPEIKTPEPRRRLLGSTALKIAAGIAGVCVVCGFLAFPPTVESEQQLVTRQTEWHTDKLKDGSGVLLGPDTALNFQVSKAERKVAFRHGQALFEVKKDAKPFVVHTGAVSVVAVGTEFAVKQLDGPPEVTVKEGTVLVEPAEGKSILVTEGEQLTIVEGKPLAVRKVDLNDQLQWVKRLWNFNGMTVTQVVAELNRRNAVKIDIDETALRGDTVIYGTVKLDDPMTFAQWLTADRNLVIDRRRDNVLRLTAAKPGMQ